MDCSRTHAAFAHPKTKIIFAIAGGTHSIQIKIPVSELDAFPELQPPDHNTDLGSSVWVSSRLNEAEDKRLLQIAFDCRQFTDVTIDARIGLS